MPVEIACRRLGAPRAVEAWSAVVMLALQFAVRIAYDLRLRVDTDEPQHLHVAWAWTKGLLPYRDVFDNHTPLFHMLSAPLVALIGETPRILVLMRLAMIPFFAATLLGSFLIGRRLFGRRAGLWSAILCGLCPTFFFKSLSIAPTSCGPPCGPWPSSCSLEKGSARGAASTAGSSSGPAWRSRSRP